VCSLNGTEVVVDADFAKTLTKTGSYKLGVTYAGAAIANAPFHFQVLPASPSALLSKHLPKVGASLENTEAHVLDLRVFPSDEFGNTITEATGYSITVGEHPPVLISAPDFDHTHTVPIGFLGAFNISFKLDGADIKGSPIGISVVAPPLPPGQELLLVVVAAVGGLLVLFMPLFALYRRKKKRETKNLMAESKEVKRQKSLLRKDNDKLGSQKVLLQVRTDEMKQQKDKAELQKKALQVQNKVLHDSLRQKKHSDTELKVMKRAMDEMKQERIDELRSVLVPSAEVKIETLLGQGGMGKVHLGEFKGQKVAVKSLLVINEENCKRFR